MSPSQFVSLLFYQCLDALPPREKLIEPRQDLRN